MICCQFEMGVRVERSARTTVVWRQLTKVVMLPFLPSPGTSVHAAGHVLLVESILLDLDGERYRVRLQTLDVASDEAGEFLARAAGWAWTGTEVAVAA